MNCEKEKNTLYRPFEKGFAGLTGGHPVVVSWGGVATHQAKSLGNGVEHVLALDGRVVHHADGALLVAAQAGGAASEHARVEHRRGVQGVRVPAAAVDVAAAGVRVAAGTVVAAGVYQRGGRTGGLGFDVRTAARG